MTNDTKRMAELIDAAIAKFGSVAEVARQLKISAAFVSQMKAGTHPVPAFQAGRIAKLLGRDPLLTALQTLAEHGRTFEERTFWTSLARELQGLPARGRTKIDKSEHASP